MGFVRVSPELGLIFDPMKGVVSEQRADVVLYTFDPVYDRIDKLDKIADDLVNQLVPDNELLSRTPTEARPPTSPACTPTYGWGSSSAW